MASQISEAKLNIAWTPPPVVMKLGTHIMPPEHIWTAYSINTSQRRTNITPFQISEENP
jgi:hypothetical protein